MVSACLGIVRGTKHSVLHHMTILVAFQKKMFFSRALRHHGVKCNTITLMAQLADLKLSAI